MGKGTFIIYTSFYKPIEKLTNEQLGRLFRTIFLYNLDEEVQIDEDIEMAFEFFRNQFDVDESRYQKMVERNRANGQKGGAPAGNQNAAKQPKQPTGLKTTQTTQNNRNNPKQANMNMNMIMNMNNKKEIVKEKNTTQFKPPSLGEVRTYILKKNYQVDAEAFVAYYDSNGWMVGRNKMKNWKSALVTWQKKEIQYKSNNNNTYDRRQQAKQATLARQNSAIDRIIEEETLRWEQQQLSDGGSIEGIQARQVH